MVELAAETYRQLGFRNIDAILARSDLYPREGKNQHAYAVDIDREGDVRTFLNVERNARWMGTLLHELGHTIYQDGIDRTELPCDLRDDPQGFLNEGFAMFCEQPITDPHWLSGMVGVAAGEAQRLWRRAGRAGHRVAARVRALVSDHRPVRARVLRRSRSGPEPPVVGPRGAVSAGPAARRARRARLGGQDPRRDGARLLPEVPARTVVLGAARAKMDADLGGWWEGRPRRASTSRGAVHARCTLSVARAGGARDRGSRWVWTRWRRRSPGLERSKWRGDATVHHRVLPCYNDAGTIASVVIAADRTLRELTDEYEIIVANDASTDNSAEILEELGELYPRLRVLHHRRNHGYGGNLRSMFAAATKDLIFYTDGDAQYDPAELSSCTRS